ncbi:carbohydrate kinase family protein [Adhaeretor mobilis]|uniref:2-dehydro-3-deoxygluconokinase n=1 Tax=Adhaeretor mobilis TaxID=1930276 RepID=A0A517MZS4_9BACT|nr:carbohydrate kinase family protein [Adhaeretor mobilis]QDT00383.1 2-dehydro-3-deoxygluconokinase [Adhaeretor mobilis]
MPDHANKTLDEKLTRILDDPSCDEFLLADAKDADMAFGIAAPGKNLESKQFRSLQEYRDIIRQNTQQGLIDIMLMSASTNEVLTLNERLFDQSRVTPAIRANDTTDIWLARGGIYSEQPSRPFRSASIDHAMCGKADCQREERQLGADLGLYSITFNNDTVLDAQALSAYREFCLEAERKGFRHFLEIFDPNCPVNPIADVGSFVNDHIVRALAGVTERGRPLFLKMVYHGPASLEELVSYDSSLVVGILGGSSGTTYDAFQQLWEAKKYGARVALYGRMINNSEHQLTFIKHLRYLADGQLTDAAEAVRSYHNDLAGLGIRPFRTLEEDLHATNRYFDYSSKTTSAVSRRESQGKGPERPRPEVVVAGHICLDIIPEFPQETVSANALIEPGKLKVIGPAAHVTGGCVANVGLTLHQLGVRTSLMGKIGDDSFGNEILNILQNTSGDLADGMIVAPGEHASYSLVIMPSGVDRSFLHFPAANDTFSAEDIQLELLKGAKLFHFGYPPLMQRFWEDGGTAMARLFRSVKEQGPMTSLDMAMPDPTAPAGEINWSAWLERVLPHVALFMPSLEEVLFMLDPTRHHELAEAGQVDTFDHDLLSQTADRLISLGAGIVVLKLGSHGLYLKSSSDAERITHGFYDGKRDLAEWVARELYAPCFEVEVASTNGAGDRTIAGFLAAISRDANPGEALEKAVAVGAMSVEASDPVVEAISLEAIDKRISRGWKRRQIESHLTEKFTRGESGCWRGKQDQVADAAASTIT